MIHYFFCTSCLKLNSHESDLTTGYGTAPNGEVHCFECCGKQDKADMLKNGKATLYLDTKQKTVGNWPGTLKFAVQYLKVGNHNFTQKRYDCWFFDEKGFKWHGVQYGDNTQIVHCRRIKQNKRKYEFSEQ